MIAHLKMSVEKENTGALRKHKIQPSFCSRSWGRPGAAAFALSSEGAEATGSGMEAAQSLPKEQHMWGAEAGGE